jgi:hypothetical protein
MAVKQKCPTIPWTTFVGSEPMQLRCFLERWRLIFQPVPKRLARRSSIAGAILVGVAALLSACGDDSEPTAEQQGVQGTAGLCADLGALRESLQEFEDLSPSTTINEAKEVRDKVNLSLSELQEAESKLPSFQIARLQSSFESFNAELDSLASGNTPAEQPLQEYAATLKARAAGINEAEDQISAQTSCPN